jgi:hypothetical protein
MTAQKSTFQEVRNNILHIFVFIFIGFFFACGQRKVENKVVGNQGDTTKFRYYRDSAFWALQKLQHIKDTNHIYTSINSVKNIEITNDKLRFIYVDNFTVMADFALQKDCYVLRWDNKKWNVIDSVKFGWIPNVSETIDTLQLADVDFDGQQEIVLRFSSVSGSRSNCPYEFFKYDKKTKQVKHFYSVSDSTDQSMPAAFMVINPQEKTILFGGDGGTFSQRKTVYCWQSDTLQAIKEITIIFHNEQKHRIKEQKLDNLDWKIIKNKVYSNRKAWDYFEKWQ